MKNKSLTLVISLLTLLVVSVFAARTARQQFDYEVVPDVPAGYQLKANSGFTIRQVVKNPVKDGQETIYSSVTVLIKTNGEKIQVSELASGRVSVEWIDANRMRRTWDSKKQEVEETGQVLALLGDPAAEIRDIQSRGRMLVLYKGLLGVMGGPKGRQTISSVECGHPLYHEFPKGGKLETIAVDRGEPAAALWQSYLDKVPKGLPIKKAQ